MQQQLRKTANLFQNIYTKALFKSTSKLSSSMNVGYISNRVLAMIGCSIMQENKYGDSMIDDIYTI